jgi:ABC-type multidrug transport system permease subunit
MKIKVVYPEVSKKTFQRRIIIKYLKWPFILASLITPIINILVGGLAWSVIVVVGLYMTWHLLVSPDLFEYNRISQFIKFSIYCCILILLIDLLLVGGWALEVISIINFAALIVSGFLLYTDFNHQKHNLFPIFFLIVIGLVWATVGLISLNIPSWILIVLACIALLSLGVIIIVLKGDFIRELKCRLHLK